MNKNQITLCKNSYMTPSTKPDGKTGTLGEYMRFCLDGSLEFVSSKDLIIFDDTNELLHCICVNDDMRSQADFPIKVMSSEYSMVQQLESIMSQKNFEKFLDEGFLSTIISNDKKTFIKNWSKTINNAATSPMDAEPCYNNTIKIAPKHTSVIERFDADSKGGAYVTNTNGKVRIYDTSLEALNDIRDGDYIKLNEDAIISDTIVIDSDINAVIYMNNIKISSSSSQMFSLMKGKLTFTGEGNIECAGHVFSMGTNSTAELVLNSGINVKSACSCVEISGSGKLNSSADMLSTSNYAVINGIYDADNEITINIYGGYINSEEYIAIYNNQNGIINISNATVVGTSAIYALKGNITLKNCYVNSNGSQTAYASTGTVTGDCVYIESGDSDSPTVFVNGGTYISTNSYAITEYNSEFARVEDSDNIKIIKGTFKGGSIEPFIPDGYTFSEDDGAYIVVSE